MSNNISPRHYQNFSNGAEVIDITENLTFNGGNAVKYLARSTRTDGISKGQQVEDLQKARWYVQREIDRIVEDAEIIEEETSDLILDPEPVKRTPAPLPALGDVKPGETYRVRTDIGDGVATLDEGGYWRGVFNSEEEAFSLRHEVTLLSRMVPEEQS